MRVGLLTLFIVFLPFPDLLCFLTYYNCGMLRWLRRATAYIYDILISTFFTVAAHLSIIDHMSLSSGNFLDVGCGTGKPLMEVVERIKKKHDKIVGVDLHQEYTRRAKELFKDDKRV